MKYGIWRSEKRARFFRTEAGFLKSPVTGKVFDFDTVSEAAGFLKSELAEVVGTDYEIRSI